MWLVQGKTLYRRAAGAGWEAAPLPRSDGAELAATSVVAVRDDAVWVAAEAAKTAFVLTNVKTPPAFALPGEAAAALAGGDRAAFRKGETVVRLPASAVCEQPHVLLIEHCPPTAKDFPEVAERIRGKPELTGVELVTETSQKWTFLGATAPSMGVAKKLVEAVKGVPRVDAKVFCHIPRVKAHIPIESPAK